MSTFLGKQPWPGGRRVNSPRITFSGLVSWIPLAAFLVLMLFASIAWHQVGHWPSYSTPDPKELRLPILYALALLAVPVGLLSAFVGLIALIGSFERWRKWHIGIFVIGALLWASNMGRAGHLLNWLLD